LTGCTLVSAFVCAITMLLTHNTRQKNLRFSNTRITNKQHEQWKAKRKLIVEKGAWDEDDDFVSAVPFHVQDDDATIFSNQTQIMEENESETYMERYNDGLNENSARIKGESTKKEKGIVYSDSAGDKESEIVSLPPPPPHPSTENSTVNGHEVQMNDDTKNNTKQESTSIKKELAHNKTTQIHATNSKHNSKHTNKEQPTQEDESKPADTIFDDLLRGFTFAATFCALVICIYKFCVYVCVKCGIYPDERVMRARLRRSRLKKKRAYGDSNVVPPLDTRKWAEWSAKRGRVNGGVWDSGFDDIENNGGSHGDGDDGSEAGAIVFDNSGIEMAEWEDNGKDSGSEMELEFGEGEELEDRIHDERLFDADDNGKGVEKEADMFFEKQSKKKVSNEKTTQQQQQQLKKNASDKLELKLISVLDEKVDKDDQPPLLFNASFDALDPPSGQNRQSSEPQSNGIDSSSSSAKEFLLEVTKSGHPDFDTNNTTLQDDDQQIDEVDNSFGSADDRGYDEDADLLGLRSDSPPPLDLEEIEKNLVENMNNAKLY